MAAQYEKFKQALQLLNGRLVIAGAPRFNLVVCGGSALIATGLLDRVTKDVDVVALMGEEGDLLDPAPLPQALVLAAHEVAVDLGLPQGFDSRLAWQVFGEKLSVGFISRYDQIHFKLYAAVDQSGSYHAEDLRELQPSDEELLDAARWARTHDPSEGFIFGLQWFFKEFNREHLVDKI